MRRALLVLAGLVGAVVPHLTGAIPSDATAPPLARPSVDVHVECEGGRLASSVVDPDPVVLLQGDSLEWTLSDSSDVEAFAIQPVTMPGQPKPWPFADDVATRRGTRDRPARARRMRANAEGRYRYAIVAQCPTGTGTDTREVEIDPDIIIRAR